MAFWDRIVRALRAALIELRSAKSSHRPDLAPQCGDLTSSYVSSTSGCESNSDLKPNFSESSRVAISNIIRFRIKHQKCRSGNLNNGGEQKSSGISKNGEWHLFGYYEFLEIEMLCNFGIFKINFHIKNESNFTFPENMNIKPIEVNSISSEENPISFTAWRILTRESRCFSQEFTTNDFDGTVKIGQSPLFLNFNVTMTGFSRPRNAIVELTSKPPYPFNITTGASLGGADHYLSNTNTLDKHRTYSSFIFNRHWTGLVSGHWRKTKNGKMVWVKPHIRK